MTFDIVLNIGAIILAIYIVGVAIYIIMENRSPQSTFAWLLLFMLLPIIGLLIYIFLGRGWHAFSQENKMARQELGSDLLQDLWPAAGSAAGICRPHCQGKTGVVPPENSATGSSQLQLRPDRLQRGRNSARRHVRSIPACWKISKPPSIYIHLNYYIWTEDEFTLQVKEALIERAKAGIEVRCLYDASGGVMSKQYLQDLDRRPGSRSTLTWSTARSEPIHTANYRSHRKIAVIDGKIGYVGGLNLDKEQLDAAGLSTPGAILICAWWARRPAPCRPVLSLAGSIPPARR